MATPLRALTLVVVLLCLAWSAPAEAAPPKTAPDPFADLFGPSRAKAAPTPRHRPNLARLHRQPKVSPSTAQVQAWSRMQPVSHANPAAGELLLSDYAPGRHALAGP